MEQSQRRVFSVQWRGPLPITYSLALDLPNGYPVTLEAWVYRTSGSIPQRIAGKRAGCGGGGDFYQLAIDRNAPGTGMSVDPNYVPLNVCTHLAMVIDGASGWLVYANAALVKTVYSPGWPIQNPGQFEIGGAPVAHPTALQPTPAAKPNPAPKPPAKPPAQERKN